MTVVTEWLWHHLNSPTCALLPFTFASPPSPLPLPSLLSPPPPSPIALFPPFQLDPELDFDREVYPLGVSPAAGVIVGVSQRLSLNPGAHMPCFEPCPQAQPILPCLLRHLLQVGGERGG